MKTSEKVDPSSYLQAHSLRRSVVLAYLFPPPEKPVTRLVIAGEECIFHPDAAGDSKLCNSACRPISCQIYGELVWNLFRHRDVSSSLIIDERFHSVLVTPIVHGRLSPQLVGSSFLHAKRTARADVASDYPWSDFVLAATDDEFVNVVEGLRWAPEPRSVCE